MTNDPKWVRFAADSTSISQSPPSPEGQRGVPTLGIGAYACGDCGKPHVTFATITPDGMEISILLSPETAGQVVQTVVEKLGDLGVDYLALRAFRALTMANELATMTDTEADFLDGAGLREWARMLVNGGNPMLARRYSSEQRDAAADVLHPNAVADLNDRQHRLELVDYVAVELGLTKF